LEIFFDLSESIRRLCPSLPAAGLEPDGFVWFNDLKHQENISMSEYQSRQDLALSPELVGLASIEARAFLSFDHAAKRAGGAIPPKVREWLSLAVALTTQCGYCIDVHAQAAKKLGTTREELAEIALVAAAVRAGATLGHGLLALRLFDEASATPRAEVGIPNA
jgi:AhpD family alkylhydroperoxidase